MDIDVSELDEDIDVLTKLLQCKLQKKITVHRKTLQIKDNISTSKVKNILKQALHKNDPGSYSVISQSGSLKIKKKKSRIFKSKAKKGTPPSAPQSMPYFFPG